MNARPGDEAELVRRCLASEPGAAEELIALYQGEIYSLCFRMLRHHQDAEDVAQEVSLRMVRSLSHWDATRPLKPWVMMIAVNRCRTALQKRQKLPAFAEATEHWPARPQIELEQDLSQTLELAVAALRPDYREVFILYHEQGQPYEAIAEIVGRPVGTVKTWLHRARLDVLMKLREAGHAQPMNPVEKLTKKSE